MKKFCMQMRDKLTKLNFEFGDGKDKWDKLIDEMAENAKEAGIPWPPKEPEIVPDTRDDNSRTMSSDSPEVEEKKSDIDEMKKIIDELVHLSNELEIPVVTAQQTSYTREEVEAIKKEAADKAIEDFLKDSADDDYYGKRMTPLCRCSTDSLIGELHKRLVLINKSENIVKLNFVTNNREKLGKLTHLIDSIKRCDVDTKTTVDTDEIQRIIHQLREEMKKAYNVFTDTDGKYVRVFFNQLRAEVGMSNVDEVFGAVLQGAAFEACDAVFGYDVVHVVARGADGGTFGEEGFDARDGASGCSAGHSNDGFALAGEGCPADEVHLSTDAAVLPHAYGFAGHLSLQVDFEARVDGDHTFVFGDDEWAVDVVYGMEFDVGVLVDEVV